MPYKDKEKQRAAQREYDEKRRGTRHRGWVWVSYPESIDAQWREKLVNEGVPIFISPLHDRDANADGTPKKPHNHALMLWDNSTTYEVARAIADAVGAVMPPKNPKPGAPKPWAQNVRTAARYLCHLDNPDKAQYSPEDVTCINCTLADYYEIISSDSDDDELIDEMIDYIAENHIISFAKFVLYCRKERKDWKRLVYHKCAYIIKEYIRSNRYDHIDNLEERERNFEQHIKETEEHLREKLELEAGNMALEAIENYINHYNANNNGSDNA